MKTLLWGNAIFFAALLLQLAVWKISLPRRQAKALGLLLLLVSLAGLAALLFMPGLPFRPETAPEFAHLALYLISFGLAYLITYSAIEVDSPSLLIIGRIAGAGPRGIDAGALRAGLDNGTLVKPRLDDLVSDRMAALENGRYSLLPKGAVLALVFFNFRRLLKAGKGG